MSSSDANDQEFFDLDDLIDTDHLNDADDAVDNEVPNLVANLLDDAIRVGASAIHVEPTGDGALQTRLRVGTALRAGPTIPRGFQRGVVARLKVLAQLDVTERRLPQWGEFTTERETGASVFWRVVTLPGTPDERLTIHVSLRDSSPAGLDDILRGKDLAAVRSALDAGRGLVLVAGPRWSGGDRLLKACVRDAARPDRAVVSIGETPQGDVPGVHQVVVRPDAGLETAVALRAAARSAVDVIHVHTLDDAETLRWALHAAVHGCLVLAAIPTDDSTGAVLRLLEAPVAPGLVAEALSLVIGVRQIPRLCPHCRQGSADAGFTAPGCDECGTTGYQGTVMVHHVAPMDGSTRRAIRSGDADAIGPALRTAAGTLRDAALAMVECGEISPADALRETPDPDR